MAGVDMQKMTKVVFNFFNFIVLLNIEYSINVIL